jgi:dGTP triphosphohydrolase
MSDKQTELVEWLNHVAWNKFIYDKEVEVLVTQLQERIESLSGAFLDDLPNLC